MRLSETEENINRSKNTLTVLQREQDPDKFLQNLCMTSLDRLDCKEYNQMERLLAGILRERSKGLT